MFNWSYDQHKAHAAEQERRARKHQQVQEILRDKDNENRSPHQQED